MLTVSVPGSFWRVGEFEERVSLCSADCTGTHCVDGAGLELRDFFASSSRVLELRVYSTILGFNYWIFETGSYYVS